MLGTKNRQSWSMVPYPKLAAATTPAEMRAAIEAVMYDHSAVNQVIRLARRDGLSAEDTYTILAYHALQMHATTAIALAEVMAILPPRMIIVKESGNG